MTAVAVYVHIPFCPTKCGYCDFNSYAMTGEIIERTAHAIAQEIRQSPWRGRPAKTIFFGGGTPTYLSESQLIPIIEAVLESHPPTPDCEFTSEANPGTVDMPKFAAMRRAGVNRISLGAQSFARQDLVRLGRVHQATEIARAVGVAREGGFHEINLDLMFGLPGQSMAGWERNLETALSLSPTHLSLYGLTIEPNTRYYKLHLRGMLDLPTEDVHVEMYDRAMDAAEAAGLEQYEISNFARPGSQCQHNLAYWRGEEYLGYGPGAVGCFQEDGRRHRYTVLKHPERYCQAIEQGTGLWFDEEWLDEDDLRLEKLMLGLRLNEGLCPTIALPERGLAKVVERGWLERSEDRLRLTRSGRHFCTEVAAELA